MQLKWKNAFKGNKQPIDNKINNIRIEHVNEYSFLGNYV